MKYFVTVLLIAGFLSQLISAKEMEPGLAYLRPSAKEQNILETKDAWIIDLRGASETGWDFAALQSSLKSHSPLPAFILLNARSSPAITKIPSLAGLLVVAPDQSGIPTALTVKVSPEKDEQAVSLIEKGTDPVTLIQEKLKKPRYDEASLVRDHQHLKAEAGQKDGEADADEVEPVTTSPKNQKETGQKNINPAPIRDEVLERAVQIYRAIEALHIRS